MTVEQIYELDLKEQEKIFHELESTGQIFLVEKMLRKLAGNYTKRKNGKKLKELLSLFKNKKKYKKIVALYETCAEIILGSLDICHLFFLRESYLKPFKGESKVIRDYELALREIQSYFHFSSELIDNENLYIRFLQKITQFDELKKNIKKSDRFLYDKRFLIKQFILFPKDDILLNHGVLALYHGGGKEVAFQLYQYLLDNKLPIILRVKYWSDLNKWAYENKYKVELVNEQTEILQAPTPKLDLKQLLRESQGFEKDKKEGQRLLKYYLRNQKINDTDVKDHLGDQADIMAKTFKGDRERVQFYLENQCYDQALNLIEDKIEAGGKKEELISWYYLKLHTLYELKDYQACISWTENFQENWAEIGAAAIDLWYISAESYLVLGYDQLAEKYYRKVFLINPHYRQTKTRLEEIEARK